MTDIPPLFNDLWFQLFMGAAIGLTLGSFVTMLSYRLPRKISIVTPSSHCPVCKARLRARDLIPLFSWIASSGACRYCRTKISPRYPLIELLMGICGGLAFAFFGIGWALLVALIATVIVVTLVTVKIEN